MCKLKAVIVLLLMESLTNVQAAEKKMACWKNNASVKCNVELSSPQKIKLNECCDLAAGESCGSLSEQTQFTSGACSSIKNDCKFKKNVKVAEVSFSRKEGMKLITSKSIFQLIDTSKNTWDKCLNPTTAIEDMKSVSYCQFTWMEGKAQHKDQIEDRTVGNKHSSVWELDNLSFVVNTARFDRGESKWKYCCFRNFIEPTWGNLVSMPDKDMCSEEIKIKSTGWGGSSTCIDKFRSNVAQANDQDLIIAYSSTPQWYSTGTIYDFSSWISTVDQTNCPLQTCNIYQKDCLTVETEHATRESNTRWKQRSDHAGYIQYPICIVCYYWKSGSKRSSHFRLLTITLTGGMICDDTSMTSTITASQVSTYTVLASGGTDGYAQYKVQSELTSGACGTWVIKDLNDHQTGGSPLTVPESTTTYSLRFVETSQILYINKFRKSKTTYFLNHWFGGVWKFSSPDFVLQVDCPIPTFDFSSFVDKTYNVPSTETLGSTNPCEESVYQLSDFFSVDTTDTTNCFPLRSWKVETHSGSQTVVQGNAAIGTCSDTVVQNIGVAAADATQLKVDKDRPYKLKVSINFKNWDAGQTVQDQVVQSTHWRTIQVLCNAPTIFTPPATNEYDLNSLTTSTFAVKFTNLITTFNSRKDHCVHQVILQQWDGASFVPFTHAALEVSNSVNAQWNLSIKDHLLFDLQRLRIKVSITNDPNIATTEWFTSEFSMKTKCKALLMGSPSTTPYVLEIPGTLGVQWVYHFDVLTSAPSREDLCPITVTIEDKDNSNALVTQYLRVDGSAYPYKLQIDSHALFGLLFVQVRAKIAGINSVLSTGFKVENKCMALTLGAPVAADNPKVNEIPTVLSGSTPVDLFNLLSVTPSDNSVCALTFVLEDLATSTVITSGVTLASAYPFTVQIDIHTLYGPYTRLQVKASINGVEAALTSEFSVESKCKALTLGAPVAADNPKVNVIPAVLSGSTPVDLFNLLSVTPSHNSVCALTFVLEDLATSTVITSDITLASAYPFTVQIDIHTLYGPYTRLQVKASINGVETALTAEFLVESKCMPIDFVASLAQTSFNVISTGETVNDDAGPLFASLPSDNSICPLTVEMRNASTDLTYLGSDLVFDAVTYPHHTTVKKDRVITTDIKYVAEITVGGLVVNTATLGTTQITCLCKPFIKLTPITTFSKTLSTDGFNQSLINFASLWETGASLVSMITECDHEMVLEAYAGAFISLGTNQREVFSNSTTEFNNHLVTVKPCWKYDCAGTVQSAEFVLTVTYTCLDSTMTFVIDSPFNTFQRLGAPNISQRSGATQTPLNFEIGSITSTGPCKVKSVDIRKGWMDVGALTTPLSSFSPVQFDLTIPAGPTFTNIKFAMILINDTWAEHNFSISVTFGAANLVRFLDFGAAQIMTLDLVDPCSLPSVTISCIDSSQIDLLEPLRTVATRIQVLDIDASIMARFVLTPTFCLADKIVLLDSIGSAIVSTDKVQLQTGTPPFLDIPTDAGYTNTTYRIRASTMGGDTDFFLITVKVCGFEVLTVSPTYDPIRVILQGTLEEMFLIELQSYVVHNDPIDCPLTSALTSFDDMNLTTIITDPGVATNTSGVYIDTLNVRESQFFVKLITTGLVSLGLNVEYYVCLDTCLASTATVHIDEHYALNQASDNLTDQMIVQVRAIYEAWAVVNNCSYCELKSYEVLNSLQNPYVGSNLMIGASNNLVSQTALSFPQTQFWLKISTSVAILKCNFIQPKFFSIKLEVCGNETVTATDLTVLQFNVTVDEDVDPITIKGSDIRSWFDTNSDPCNLTFFVSNGSTGLHNISSASWNSYVNFPNGSLNGISDLVINYHDNHGFFVNTTVDIFVRAISGGLIEAFRNVQIIYTVIPPDTPLITVVATPDPEPEPEVEEEVEEVEEEPLPEPEPEEEPIVKQVVLKKKPKIKSTSVVVSASQTPWLAKINADKFSKLLKEAKKNKKPKEIIDPKPVVLRIEKVTRNGMMIIEFNQKLKVPAFLDVSPDAKGDDSAEILNDKARRLIPLSALDVSSQVMDIQLILKSDVEIENIEYFLEVKNWTTVSMDVFINFTDPLLISKGRFLDEVICKVLNRDLFQAQDSNQVLMSDRIYIQEDLPRQLFPGVKEADLLSEAEAAGNGMKAMFFVQIALQICLKGAITDLWLLYFTLQIMVYLTIYDIPLPGNTEIYLEEFKKLIEFDILNPDGVGRMITGDESFLFISWIQGKDKWTKGSGSSVMDDLQLYLILSVAFIAFLLVLCMVMSIQSLRKKIIELLKKVKESTIYNGIIRSITIVYIKFAISFGEQTENYMRFDEEQSMVDRFLGLSLFIGLFGYIFFVYLVIRRFRDRLSEPQIKNKIDNLYQDIQVDIPTKTVENHPNYFPDLRSEIDRRLNYYPVFLLRRIIFVAIPTFLYAYPFLQVQLLLFLTSLYIIAYFQMRPHPNSRRIYVEVANEWFMLTACYHLICFSGFNLNSIAYFQMGYSYVALLFIVIVFNIGLMIYKAFEQYAWNKRMKGITKIKKKNWDELQIKIAAKKKVRDIKMYYGGGVWLEDELSDEEGNKIKKLAPKPKKKKKSVPKPKKKYKPFTIIDQKRLFEKKWEDDKIKRFVKFRNNDLPVWYTYNKVFKKKALDEETQMHVYAKLQPVDPQDVDSEYKEDYEEVKQMINDTFGQFGDFAEYNRNCMLFGYRICATPPNDEQLLESKLEYRAKIKDMIEGFKVLCYQQAEDQLEEEHEKQKAKLLNIGQKTGHRNMARDHLEQNGLSSVLRTLRQGGELSDLQNEDSAREESSSRRLFRQHQYKETRDEYDYEGMPITYEEPAKPKSRKAGHLHLVKPYKSLQAENTVKVPKKQINPFQENDSEDTDEQNERENQIDQILRSRDKVIQRQSQRNLIQKTNPEKKPKTNAVVAVKKPESKPLAEKKRSAKPPTNSKFTKKKHDLTLIAEVLESSGDESGSVNTFKEISDDGSASGF